MKKLVMLMAIGATLVSAGAWAQSTDQLMFGGKAGFAKPHGSSNDSGFNIAGVLGKRIQDNVYWEAELSLGIIDGEGAGSVVETHATRLRPGVTAITEATLATSNRFGFRLATRAARMVRKRGKKKKEKGETGMGEGGETEKRRKEKKVGESPNLIRGPPAWRIRRTRVLSGAFGLAPFSLARSAAAAPAPRPS